MAESADRYVAGVEKAGWRPIESAPTDGSEVWLDHTLSSGGYACKGRWNGERWSVPHYFLGTIKGHGAVMLTQPNVWQPLPTPGGSDEAV